MPRAEVGTPKYIANKMKAKGLQKLRWYCQMCQKQCRDENGFKCHTMSESHQRQILLFSDNSKRIIDDFSYEFAKEYLTIVRRQFGTKRVNANRVYQEYIKDRNHIHMNATRWVTLGGFVKWLGRTGKCEIDETEKGWFITYCEKDAEEIARENRKNKKIKMDKDDEEKTLEFVQKQVEIAKQKTGDIQEPVYTELLRESEEEKVTLDLKMESVKKEIKPVIVFKIPKRPIDDDNMSMISTTSSKKSKCDNRKKTALDEIKEQEEMKKETQNRKDYWITEGIVVKVMTKSLGEEYYKQKGVVREVSNRYVAIVKLFETGKKLKLDQEHLETVLPAIGKLVKVVNGAYRGETATLEAIDERNFSAKIKISSGLLMGRVVSGVEYEDICKINEQ